MIDEKYIELMHKELDGVISAEEQKLLMGYLLEHADAKIFYQELKDTVVLIDQVPQADVPEKMRERIMDSINKEKYARDPYRGNVPQMIQNWFTSPRPKMAFAFALGVLLAIFIYMLLPPGTGINNRDLYGTMGFEMELKSPVAESVSVNINGLKGNFIISQTGEILRIETELTGAEKFNLSMEYDNQHLRFENFIMLRPGETSINTHKNTLEILNISDIECIMTLRKTIPGESSLKILLSDSDKRLFTHETTVTD